MLPAIIAALMPAVGKAAEGVAAKIGAPERAQEIEQEMASAIAMQQLAVNAAEAKHRSLFVAGWRPAVGWLCVVGLSTEWVVLPVVSTVWTMQYGTVLPVPALGTGEMLTLLTGILGMGSLRSWEKSRGLTQ